MHSFNKVICLLINHTATVINLAINTATTMNLAINTKKLVLEKLIIISRYTAIIANEKV